MNFELSVFCFITQKSVIFRCLNFECEKLHRQTLRIQRFDAWNTFVSKAKNATFLFHRNFMEYHKNRFQDFSLVVQEDQKWVAVLPANIVGAEVNTDCAVRLIPKSDNLTIVLS